MAAQLMYLLDTNIWLERLLKQERSEEVQRFLTMIASNQLFITDLSFHSIGIILDRLNKRDLFLRFTFDVFDYGAITYIDLAPRFSGNIVQNIERFNLDFEDAYQYTVSEKYNIQIISFDSDFDRTERGRKTPGQVVKQS